MSKIFLGRISKVYPLTQKYLTHTLKDAYFHLKVKIRELLDFVNLKCLWNQHSINSGYLKLGITMSIHTKFIIKQRFCQKSLARNINFSQCWQALCKIWEEYCHCENWFVQMRFYFKIEIKKKSVTCGPVVPRQVVCSAVFLPYSNLILRFGLQTDWLMLLWASGSINSAESGFQKFNPD